MKTELDFEKIQYIIEKTERGEFLDASEKAIADIIDVIKIQKNQKVILDGDFQNTLKKKLLTKYDELYNKSSWHEKISGFFNTPFVRFTVSFCFLLTLTFGIYNGLEFAQNNQSAHRGIEFGSSPSNHPSSSSSKSLSDISSSNTFTESEKKSEISPGQVRSGINFGGSNNITLGIKGVSDDNYGVASKTSFIYISIIIIIFVISFFFALRGKRKDYSNK